MTMIGSDLSRLLEGFHAAQANGTLTFLVIAVLIACLFEFINGFHDTANSVATVIYTRSMKPAPAVIWSGICNFIGVWAGGIAVAMGILKLLPPQILGAADAGISLIAVFSMLIASCIWNFMTWFWGLPASSSHALIGGILGIGVGFSLWNGMPIASGLQWAKVGEVGLSLLISPLLGFGLSGALLYLLKKQFHLPKLHQAPKGNEPPPFLTRLLLIGTSSGVSFAHGSNDGQKGVGLIMLILIGVLPAQFALNPTGSSTEAEQVRNAAKQIELRLSGLAGVKPATSGIEFLPAAYAADAITGLTLAELASESAKKIETGVPNAGSLSDLPADQKIPLRSAIFKLDSQLSALEKSGVRFPDLAQARKTLKARVEYAPSWVLLIVSLSLGLGTMVGWRRIAVTIGEKIGSTEMTYAQGAVSQAVAASMIGFSSLAGVPVSTTHCLSSGVAGTMVAAGSRIQAKTVKSILIAWVLTLPATLVLSAGLFFIFSAIFRS